MTYLHTHRTTVIIGVLTLWLTGCASAQSTDPASSNTDSVTPVPRSITPVLHKRDTPIFTQNSYFRFELAAVDGGNTMKIRDTDPSMGDHIKTAIKNYFYSHNQSLAATLAPSIDGKPLPKQVLYTWTDDGTTQTTNHGAPQLSPLFRDPGQPIPLEFGVQYADEVNSNLVTSLFTVVKAGIDIWGSPTSLFSKISANKYQSAGENVDRAINRAFSVKKTPIVPISIDLSNNDRIDMTAADGTATKIMFSIVVTPQESLWATSSKNLPDTPPQIIVKTIDTDKTVGQLLTANTDLWVKFNNAKGKDDVPAIQAFCADLAKTLAANGLNPLDTALVFYSTLYQSSWNSSPTLRSGNDLCEFNTQALEGTNLAGKLHPRSYLVREERKRHAAKEAMKESVFEDIPTAMQTRTAASWRELLAQSVAISVEGGAFRIGQNVTVSPDAPAIMLASRAASLLAQMPVAYQPASDCFRLYEQVSTMKFYTQCFQAQDKGVVIKKVDLTFDKSFADDSSTEDDMPPLLTAIRFYL